MMLDTSRTATSNKKLQSPKRVSHTARSAKQSEQPLSKVEVKAHEQPHVSLGTFTEANPPKGFSIHLTPDPDPEAIITKVVTLGNEKKYELILHIANYGNKTVNAKIWPL
jgi:hypothetical protein